MIQWRKKNSLINGMYNKMNLNCYRVQRLLRWIMEPSVKPKTIKLLDENKGEHILDLWAGKGFFIPQKVMNLKLKEMTNQTIKMKTPAHEKIT